MQTHFRSAITTVIAPRRTVTAGDSPGRTEKSLRGPPASGTPCSLRQPPPLCARTTKTDMRAPRSRECSLLLVVELLFLFDVTFTANLCLPEHALYGFAVLAGSLLLAFLKMHLLEYGARFPVFRGVRRVLGPALIFLFSFPSVKLMYVKLLTYPESTAKEGTITLSTILDVNNKRAARKKMTIAAKGTNT